MQHYVADLVEDKRFFANCILDPMYQTLTTSNKVIRLRGKLFLVLCCLVDNQNILVTRDFLIERYWQGNSYTGKTAVTHSICHLRKILKEQNIQASIMTLSKRGYIFSYCETPSTTESCNPLPKHTNTHKI